MYSSPRNHTVPRFRGVMGTSPPTTSEGGGAGFYPCLGNRSLNMSRYSLTAISSAGAGQSLVSQF